MPFFPGLTRVNRPRREPGRRLDGLPRPLDVRLGLDGPGTHLLGIRGTTLGGRSVWMASINPRTKNLYFRGCDDSGRFLILRGGIPRSIGNLPEIQTQRFSACGFVACGLAVLPRVGSASGPPDSREPAPDSVENRCAVIASSQTPKTWTFGRRPRPVPSPVPAVGCRAPLGAWRDGGSASPGVLGGASRVCFRVYGGGQAASASPPELPDGSAPSRSNPPFKVFPHRSSRENRCRSPHLGPCDHVH